MALQQNFLSILLGLKQPILTGQGPRPPLPTLNHTHRHNYFPLLSRLEAEPQQVCLPHQISRSAALRCCGANKTRSSLVPTRYLLWKPSWFVSCRATAETRTRQNMIPFETSGLFKHSVSDYPGKLQVFCFAEELDNGIEEHSLP